MYNKDYILKNKFYGLEKNHFNCEHVSFLLVMS